MVMCWAPDCKHYNVREKCKFYQFPKEKKERNRWKKLIRRDVEPGPGAFLCSCHFRDGKKENGPELFSHNVGKRFSWSSPEKCTKGRVNRNDLPSTSTMTLDETLDLGEDPITNMATDEYVVKRVTIDEAAQPEMAGPSTSQSSVMSEAENYLLRKENSELKKYLAKMNEQFSIDHIKENDELILLYTGVPNFKIFSALFNLIKDIEINYYLQWKVEKIDKIDQLLMCLMKLRQNFPHADLAQRFNVSQATVSNIVISWVYVLHEILFKQLMKTIPTRSKNKTCLPTCFSSFTNCRIILDCTEMSTVTCRQSMKTQRMTYSSYKHMNTWKALIGVAPNGVITYVSDLYPGSTSDKKIVEDCEILKLLEPGDLILADKGFLLKDLLPPGIHINVPPFLTTSQFTPEQVHYTELIARARIHVERAIQRMKCFKILKFLPQQLIQHGDAVIQVIGALTNLQNPLIKETEKLFDDSVI